MQISSLTRAIVIGGSMGIGYSLATLLVEKGAAVGIIARNEEELLSAAANLQKRAKPNQIVEAARADATDPDALKEAVDLIYQMLGGIDLLIHCVGRAVPDYFENISNNAFDLSIKTNLSSAWYAVKATLPYLKGQGGHIVIVSSICGFLGVYGYSDYCAGKFGLVGLTEALQYELSEYNINMTLVYPPDTDTPGYQTENKTKPKETKAISANAKLLKPEQVAVEIIAGLQKHKKIIIPGRVGKVTYFAKKFFPRLVSWMMQQDIRKARQKY